MDSQVTKSGEVVMVRQYNNSSANVTSTFVGIGTMVVVNTWSTKKKTFAPADWPETSKVYNDFMGGAGKMDFLISIYPMVLCTKRLPARAILHLVSMSFVNTWVGYKEREAAQGSGKKNIMDFLSFREHVVEALSKAETNRKQPVCQTQFPKPAELLPGSEQENKTSILQTMNADMMISIAGHNPMILRSHNDAKWRDVKTKAACFVKNAMCTYV